MLYGHFPGIAPPTVAKMTQCNADSVNPSENCHQGLVRFSFSVFPLPNPFILIFERATGELH